jgi:AcrR family transcriptional regulator
MFWQVEVMMLSGQRVTRADAVRNRTKITDAARAEIARRGIDVGMDEIAQAAGVAVGTLYRHFSTKTDLVDAVVSQYVDAAAADAEASLSRAQQGDSRAVDEVVGFLRRVGESSADHVVVKAAARGLGVDPHGDTSAAVRVGAALAELIAQGKASGDIRSEITVDDLYLLMTTAPIDRPAAVRERWLTLVLPGITIR